MRSWSTLEKRFGRYTFPYLLQLLLIGQAMVYLALKLGLVSMGQLVMHPISVMQGEFWRIFTFMVVPMAESALWFLIGMYVTYLIGSALVREWGEFRFSLYVGAGWLFTLLLSFLTPGAAVGNTFIFGSLTLAFARLYPRVEFLIFFVIPMQVRYIGYVLWGYYAVELIAGEPGVRLQVVAACLPYLLFFGKDLILELRQRRRSTEFRRATGGNAVAPFHVCSRCGKTDRSHPDLNFRYRGETCICEPCLREESSK